MNDEIQKQMSGENQSRARQIHQAEGHLTTLGMCSM